MEEGLVAMIENVTCKFCSNFPDYALGVGANSLRSCARHLPRAVNMYLAPSRVLNLKIVRYQQEGDDAEIIAFREAVT